MPYSFKEVKQYYLRQFIVQLNEITINTPQENFEKFMNSFKKSADFIKTNALLETIKILDNPSLTARNLETVLASFRNISHKDKKTKIIVSNLDTVIARKPPKLFKSFNTQVKKAYLRNTFDKLLNSLDELLSKHILLAYNISDDEINSAMNKINFYSLVKKFSHRVLCIDEELVPSKIDYHFPLYDTKNCTYLALDEIVLDPVNGKYLKYLYQALFQSTQYILLSEIFVTKNKINPLVKTDLKQQKFIQNKNIQYDIATILTLKNLGKSRTSIYMVNFAHYLHLTPFQAFDMSNYYFGKGSSNKIKKDIPFQEIKNSFKDIQFSLFPNYKLYENFKGTVTLADDFFFKFATKMLLDMVLQNSENFSFNNAHLKCFTKEELDKKNIAYEFISGVLTQRVILDDFKKVQGHTNQILDDIQVLTQKTMNIIDEIYLNVYEEIKNHKNEVILTQMLKLDVNNIFKIIYSSILTDSKNKFLENN